VALTLTGHLKPGWDAATYRRVSQLWGERAPTPDSSAEDYAKAFNQRYGLHPAPYPNDGLPMGLRRGNGPDGSKVGLQIDCMVCHGGAIGGTSYVGLGNSTLDLTALLNELTRVEGRRLPPSLFVLNSTRGTVNAGMISAVLLALRNSDLSQRTFPLILGARLPELDVPPWWRLARKTTMYYDGRTDARSVRTNMQFLLGEKSLQQFRELEPTFRDIQAYLKSLTPPKYPFPIDPARSARGKAVFEDHCTKCHGTYGPDGVYPNKIVELKVIGTDPARAFGLSDRLVAHYNTTWFAEDHPSDQKMVGYQAPPLDGIWATAPFLHNGSVPTLAALLKSPERPSKFRRPPSTDFEYYDPVRVGWKAEEISGSPPSPLPPSEARYLYDSRRYGLGNGGHTFGDALEDDERLDLIEYLKTL
ncbi:c-type cytochrome, partial [Singulisphaera rosea]